MIADEYELEAKFPSEERSAILEWSESDLIDYEGRNKSNTRAGGYWFANTRLYVRQDRPDIPDPVRSHSRRGSLMARFKKCLL